METGFEPWSCGAGNSMSQPQCPGSFEIYLLSPQLDVSRTDSIINITTETLDTDSAATATAEGATTTTATTTSDDNETQGPILIKKLFLPSLTIQ